MESKKIKIPGFVFTGRELLGDGVKSVMRHLGDLKGIFGDEEAFAAMNPDTPAYSVASLLPVEEGTHGGLYMGITRLFAGKVGNEYFMTKGHFHAAVDCAEFYWGVEGEGALLLMDADRNTWAERIYPGSLHYIPGGVAHRVANIGDRDLVFAACWPSEAGHDYASIAENGFSRRLIDIDGEPTLVE